MMLCDEFVFVIGNQPAIWLVNNEKRNGISIVHKEHTAH